MLLLPGSAHALGTADIPAFVLAGVQRTKERKKARGAKIPGKKNRTAKILVG
jgi:hypothetical protein